MQEKIKLSDWLPVTLEEVKKLGWEQPDVIIISGDAYVDHPSFGTAVIGRIAEYAGLKTAIIPQPNWRDDLRDFKKLGKPRFFFGVTSGCMDSMVNHYTANKRLRSDDAYTPGGKAGFRPDYAVITYCRILKKLYPETPVVIGGVEASLRRLAHYDYWSDKIMPSILADSGADLLIYGMGEQPLLELIKQLKEGKDFREITKVPQTAMMMGEKEFIRHFSQQEYFELPSHEQCVKDKKVFAEMFVQFEKETLKYNQNILMQKTGNGLVVVNPSYPVTERESLDLTYELPYTRLPHPKYKKRGTIPAWEMIKFSVNTHRGCFGGCSFCAITAHQGKFIISRSKDSIIREVEKVSQVDSFRGVISDLGGPSANMYMMRGEDLLLCEKCKRVSCIYPQICRNLKYDHKPLTELYRKTLSLDGVKHVFIGSGIRYDMLTGRSRNEDIKYGLTEYLEQLLTRHTSGRFKVAPEHTSDKVLEYMRKPGFDKFRELVKICRNIKQKSKSEFQILPYLISAHPGCGIADMAFLAAEMKDLRLSPEQVQGFTPTPMTLSSVMYYCGFDPYTNKKIEVAKNDFEKQEQHRFFFWYLKENKEHIIKTLNKAGLVDIRKRLYSR